MYVHNFYSNLQATVHTSSFKSNIFTFKRGVFQGDPLSPIIFLLVFNPVLQFLQENSKFGYKIKEDEQFITLPYADDFCIITSDKRTQQRLMNKINEQIISMGMMIKPSKCRSFSLSSGKPSVIHFKFGENIIPSISEEEQKFLGRVLFYQGKSEECFTLLKEVISEKLENLDKTLIRNEFKIEIYQMYVLPSIRFLLTVHDLPHTYLVKLDSFTDQFLKKWAGLPRCATNSVLHLKTALDIKKISTLYKETHCTSHASTRLKGDEKVNLILDNRIQRESNFTRKKSITVEAETIYNFALNMNLVQGEIPGTTPLPIEMESDIQVINQFGSLNPPAKFVSEVKSDIKAKISSDESEKHYEHVKSLVKQGHILKLTYLEQNDATWKSYIYNLPRGTMKWLLNSAINTLPTKSNLKLWGKVSSDKCRCGKKQTLNHILNCCTPSLNEGRFTFRHDGILHYIAKCLDSDKFTCYVDLPGHQTPAGGTFPPDVLVTNLKPDIVIIDKMKKSVSVFELTVPGEQRLEIAHKLKFEKYQHFISDIHRYSTTVVPFEIGSNTGYINKENKVGLNSLHKFCKKNIKLKKFTNNISAITVMGSYYIFNCRNQNAWEDLNPIEAPFPDQ